MPILGHLTPLRGGESVPLTSGNVTIGRQAGCDIVIRHRTVSAKHCQLLFRGGSWFLRDLGSEHGTFVGRQRCEKARVQSGSVLQFGAVRVELTATRQVNPGSSAAARPSSADDDLALELLGGTSPVARSETPSVSVQRPASQQPSTAPPTPTPSPTALPRPTSQAASPTAPSSMPRRPKEVPQTKADRPVRRFLGKITPTAGGDPIALMDEQILVGRGRDCGIRLKFATVSSEHCRLEFREGHWCIRDLDSRNGVRVNGQPTVEEWLMPGDSFSIAKFRFEIDYKPRSEEPPPPFDVSAGKSLMEKAGLEKALEGDSTPGWLVTDQDPEPEQRIDLESL